MACSRMASVGAAAAPAAPLAASSPCSAELKASSTTAASPNCSTQRRKISSCRRRWRAPARTSASLARSSPSSSSEKSEPAASTRSMAPSSTMGARKRLSSAQASLPRFSRARPSPARPSSSSAPVLAVTITQGIVTSEPSTASPPPPMRHVSCSDLVFDTPPPRAYTPAASAFTTMSASAPAACARRALATKVASPPRTHSAIFPRSAAAFVSAACAS